MAVRAFATTLALLLAIPSAVLAAPSSEPAPVRVDWSQRRQPIDGFGASAEYFTRNFAEVSPAKRGEVMDLLFGKSQGAGLSISRLRVWDGGCDGPDTRCASKPTPLSHNPAPGVWAFDCPKDERSGRCSPGKPKDEWQIWFAREGKRRAPDMKVMLSVWSAPGWMKDTGRPENGGRLLDRYYPAYADYLVRNMREYATRYGVRADVLSVQNEPDFAGSASTMVWTPEQLRDFVKLHLGPRLAAERAPARLMIAEDQFWDETSSRATLQDPEAARHIGVFGSHNYIKPLQPFGGAARKIDMGYAAGRPLWMTEVCRFGKDSGFDPSIDDGLGWARSIHEFMTIPEASAWMYWMFQGPFGVGIAQWSHVGAASLISMDPRTGQVVTTKRLWAMGNYSRFVRPGFVRVVTPSDPAPGVLLTAYRNATSRDAVKDAAVIVAINEGTEPKALAMPAGVALEKAYRTSSTEDLKALDRDDWMSGQGLILAPRSVTTFTGRVAG